MNNARKNSSTLRFALRQALLSARMAITELRLSMARKQRHREAGPHVLDAMRRESFNQRRVEELAAQAQDLQAAIDLGRRAKNSPFYEG